MIQSATAETRLLPPHLPKEEQSVNLWQRIGKNISDLDKKIYGIGFYYMGLVTAFAISNLFFQAILSEECQPRKIFLAFNISLVGAMTAPLMLISVIVIRNLFCLKDREIAAGAFV